MTSFDDNPTGGETSPVARPRRARFVFTGAMIVFTIVFCALGAWQVQRLFWKLDLIARVDARVHAAPVAAPAASEWPAIDASDDEYRHVTASGIFDHSKQALVQAVTERGAGFWVVTPLVQADGTAILINRGFVPADRRNDASLVDGTTTVTGLLRLPEPGGAFLRSNDPAGDRWYSRDVAAIAAAKGIGEPAPYFIDADATPNAGELPVGGMTIVTFRNSHLVYALTWFGMAIMTAGATVLVHRRRLI